MLHNLPSGAQPLDLGGLASYPQSVLPIHSNLFGVILKHFFKAGFNTPSGKLRRLRFIYVTNGAL